MQGIVAVSEEANKAEEVKARLAAAGAVLPLHIDISTFDIPICNS
jgi:hypothetical protein